MTTRSGRSYKASSEERTMSGTEETRAEAESQATGVEHVSELVKLLVQDRQQREEQIARERAEMREHMARLMDIVERSHSGSGETSREEAAGGTTRDRVTVDPMKLTRLAEGDDIEAYLTTFERVMTAYEVERARWAVKLAPQLTGKAQKAYASLPATEAGNYETLKNAILRRYNICEETYRQRFRAATKKEGEAYRELVVRLQDIQQKWMKDCDTVEKVAELVVKEQLMNTLPTDLRVWIMERKPKTALEAGQLADDYMQARKQARDPRHGQQTYRGQPQTGTDNRVQCRTCGLTGHYARDCRRGFGALNSSGGRDLPPRVPKDRDGVRCYNCGRRGHVANRCPNNAMYCGSGRRLDLIRMSGQRQNSGISRKGIVEGRAVPDILLDTGCARTMVRADLVPQEKMVEGEAVTIRCAHGDTVLYPLAEVDLEIGGRCLTVEAAVSDGLPMSVLLGTDVPGMVELLNGTTDRPPEETVMVAITRARAKTQREEEARQAQREQDSGIQPHPLTSAGDDSVVEDEMGTGDTERETEAAGTEHSEAEDPPEASADGNSTNAGSDMDGEEPEEEHGEVNILGKEFDEELFTGGRRKPKLTRRQKRCDRQKHAKQQEESGPTPHPLDMAPEEFKKLQDEDETLAAIRKAADDQPSTAGVGFFKRNGLLYRRWTPPGRDQEEMAVEQLVLPFTCRKAVLQIAHAIPIAGHMGRDKTARRVLQKFYWPTLYRDVADFCRSCPECQKSRGHLTPRAPLIPLPIIGEPFERIAMDIVGPLPRSRSGNCYVLVVCDYATRYPEAVLLRSIDAEKIAEELIKIFARVGLPKEILTDQGSNFTSQLLAEIYRLLHVEPLRTSPYHPQTNGLVERFNQTLKVLLQRTATKEGKDWDKLLPYLLFAYREVPQASTGFSPFELLYGKEGTTGHPPRDVGGGGQEQ